MNNTLTRTIKQLGIAAAVVLGILVLNRFLPPQHNPLRPIDLTDPIGIATHFKLARIKDDHGLCYSLLDKAEVGYTRLPEDAGTERCPLQDVLVLDRSLMPYSVAPLRMTCHEMAALFIWENDVVRPLAEEMFASPVEEVLSYGSFSCRNIAGTNRLSEHARANAIDIKGFRLANGEVIDVREHWRETSARGDFLKAVHEGGCKVFSVALSPDYNAAHADHFHFDMGNGSLCR
ncbi:extensin-like domain-containing protein [Henriciella aquimarina]|uniref:extensin-like domain-containing protein n=1 Tax=Henriciella aquimarina TaxID=545261 RepID=UPI000A032B3D|nr:extensin family protein [Henriciella aquimarina]